MEEFNPYPRSRNHRCISGTRSRHSSPSTVISSRRFRERKIAGSSGGGWLSWVVLAATYPLAELVEAQRVFMAKGYVGNIVVLP